VPTEEENVMPETYKRKPMSKAAAAALKAMENIVVETADLDVNIEKLRERMVASHSRSMWRAVAKGEIDRAPGKRVRGLKLCEIPSGQSPISQNCCEQSC
jgi:hypothetical protein